MKTARFRPEADNTYDDKLTLSHVKEVLSAPGGHRAGPPAWSVAERVARFWSRVKIGSPDQCWLWQGALLPHGYGQVAAGRTGGRCRTVLAHRLAYTLTYGPIPAGAVIRHTCDTRPCCNPAHLVLGTQAENVADGVAKGRYSTPHARRYPAALLTKALAGPRGTIARLAREYDLHPHYFRLAVGRLRRQAREAA